MRIELTQEEKESFDRFSKDSDWFDKNYKLLCDKYDKQFVAVRNKKVVASNRLVSKLMTDLKKKKIETTSLFIEYVDSNPAPMILLAAS